MRAGGVVFGASAILPPLAGKIRLRRRAIACGNTLGYRAMPPTGGIRAIYFFSILSFEAMRFLTLS